jgi:hypothetical protein
VLSREGDVGAWVLLCRSRPAQYSTNIGTEFFKHGIYSPFFPLQKCSLFYNSNVFCSCIIQILYTGCAKIKKIIPAPKG